MSVLNWYTRRNLKFRNLLHVSRRFSTTADISQISCQYLCRPSLVIFTPCRGSFLPFQTVKKSA